MSAASVPCSANPTRHQRARAAPATSRRGRGGRGRRVRPGRRRATGATAGGSAPRSGHAPARPSAVATTPSGHTSWHSATAPVVSTAAHTTQPIVTASRKPAAGRNGKRSSSPYADDWTNARPSSPVAIWTLASTATPKNDAPRPAPAPPNIVNTAAIGVSGATMRSTVRPALLGTINVTSPAPNTIHATTWALTAPAVGRPSRAAPMAIHPATPTASHSTRLTHNAARAVIARARGTDLVNRSALGQRIRLSTIPLRTPPGRHVTMAVRHRRETRASRAVAQRHRYRHRQPPPS